MTAVFVYGTLQFDAVWRAAAARPRVTRPATLSGYRRYRVADALYPGIVPEAGCEVPGLLCSGFDDECLVGLDRFEGALYQRLRVEILTHQGDVVPDVWTYVVRPAHVGKLSQEPWDSEHFEATQLPQFMSEWEGMPEG
jgi:gamma-glutamylcyclotransferase (GGCT)/AIG2-like uncharacterized protein YtfP